MIGIIGSRLIAAILVFMALVTLQLLVPTLMPLVVALALIILPIIQWAAVGFFAARSMEAPEIISLRARVQDALALALAQTVGAALGLILILRALDVIQPVDRGVFLVGLAFCLLMIAAPAVNWLVTWQPWRRGYAPEGSHTEEPLALESSVQAVNGKVDELLAGKE